MSIALDLSTVTELPRQHALLRALVPSLAALEQTGVIWLTGSLARGDADRWSSVDLFLIWHEDDLESDASSSPYRTLRNTVQRALGVENLLIDGIDDSVRGGPVRGISLSAMDGDSSMNDPGPAGVFFEVSWALTNDAGSREIPVGPTRLLYSAEHLAGRDLCVSEGEQAILSSPDARTTEMQLGRFWLLLARLPAVVRRHEQLAAHSLLTEMRTLLIDLVVSLNGARRPQTRTRINQYLGQAQREAFERSLGYHQSARRSGAESGHNWVGQAVALVVLYRWYAPQLAEIHSLPYPKLAEEKVLAMLSTELETWPALITTG